MQIPRTFILPALAGLLVIGSSGLIGCFPGSGLGGGGGTSFNLPPVVVLSADVVRGIVPLTVRFSSTGSTDDGLIIARLWDFGDGQTSQEISPSHTFNTTGEFVVRLTLTDDQGARASRSITIAVTEAPVARISVDPTVAESAPALFNFDASESFDPDGEIIEYRWDFGDGSREFIPVVSHTYSSPGTYRARLTVTDDNGITGTATVVIEVGIRRPSISLVTPPNGITNVVVSNDAPLWIRGKYEVEQSIPFFTTAGLDGDSDPCEAQAGVYSLDTGAALLSLTGHADRVRSATYSTSGDLILTGSDDRTLRLYSAATGDLIQVYGGSTAAVTSVAFSPDMTLIVSGSDDGNVQLRNRITGSILREFTAHTAAVNSVAFSADGSRIVSGSDDHLAIVWNPFNGEQVRELSGHSFAVTAVAFSPTDPSLVATGSVDQTARLWDVASGATLEVFGPVVQNGQLVSGHSNSVTGVAISPDGTLLATASDDRTAKLWNLSGGPEIRTFSGHTERLTSVAFSPDQTLLATGSRDGSARVWSLATGTQEESFAPCISPVSSVDFSPDGMRLLLAVAARNDIQLDTTPASGDDLNLEVPVALNIANVPTGQYSLWVQIDTDRTEPVRSYSQAVINVIPPYTSSIDNFTPRVPLLNDRASVVVAATNDRQIYDLGPLSAGDRIHMAFLTTPGYGREYSLPGEYSVLILDSEEKMFTWYQNEFVFFTPDSKLIVGHNSPNYFVVIDRGTSVDFRIERGFGNTTRQQRILLDYRGATNIAIGGTAPFSIPPFDASDLNANWGATETELIKSRIKSRVEALYAGYNVAVFTSDDANLPQSPYQTLYFGGFSPVFFGIADYIDPRNDTLTGSALVATQTIAAAYPNLTPTEMGDAIGLVTAHEAGHLCGLRHVDNDADVMSADAPITDQNAMFLNSPIDGEEIPNGQIGFQDAPLLFVEIFGTAP